MGRGDVESESEFAPHRGPIHNPFVAHLITQHMHRYDTLPSDPGSKSTKDPVDLRLTMGF